MFNIVLVEPEIPQNTGNIARTCAATGCKLHLVEPLGFSIDQKQVRRAGLDYWDKLDLEMHESFADFQSKYSKERWFLFTTHSSRLYTQVEFQEGDFLLFGKETKGLGMELISEHLDSAITLPMRNCIRSLNLSNAVAVAVYEGIRQCGLK